MKNTSRRTVVKGAAWTAPIVAVGVAAPAFAASPGDPEITGTVGACKCPGRSTDFEFGYLFTFKFDGPAVNFTVGFITLNRNTYTPTLIEQVDSTTWRVLVSSNNSADGEGVASILYTTQTQHSLTFNYDGTHPCQHGVCH